LISFTLKVLSTFRMLYPKVSKTLYKHIMGQNIIFSTNELTSPF
jgi:hypothetical protein